MNPTLKYLSARGDRRSHYIKPKSPVNMTIDLEKEIVRANGATLAQEEQHLDEQRKLDFEAAKVETGVAEAYRAGLMAELGFDYQLSEARRIRREREQFGNLPQNRIMSIGAIKGTCLKYGLRFLPTRFYQGALDEGIAPAIQAFKAAVGGHLPAVEEYEQLASNVTAESKGKPQLYIAAPSAAFKLQPRPIDPLLFCRLNAIKYYLVHKWGDDLRTADIRKGEVSEHNWNSSMLDREETPEEMFGRVFAQGASFTTAAPNTLTMGGISGAIQAWPAAMWGGSTTNTSATFSLSNAFGGQVQ